MICHILTFSTRRQIVKESKRYLRKKKKTLTEKFTLAVKMMRATIEVIPCKICGDKSSGVHYGVITCEGCKGFFRRSQSSSVQYSCSRQSNCLIDRASRNRCQSCRLKKCIAQGMSRDAVKFGRMSKRQRDSLIAEVERHQQQQQQQQQHLQANGGEPEPLPASRNSKEPRGRPTHLNQPLVPTFPYTLDPDLSHSLEVHPYQVNVTGEARPAALTYRWIGESSSVSMLRDFDPRRSTPETIFNIPGSEIGLRALEMEGMFCPYPTLTHIEELCASIFRSHRETRQYCVEELRTLRWNIFSREEVQAYQNKSMDEMWQHCAVRLTDAVQYVVEFAKRIPGFRQLGQNDQIALLKSGSMEVVLVRMSRIFNTDNSTVFFDEKFAGTELFKSLACDDFIESLFDFAHSLCALKLTEQQVALFSALVLINADRPCLEDRDRVLRVRNSVELAFSHILRRANQESLLHKLYQKMALLKNLCMLHIEKLRWFRQYSPVTVHSLFPPLYKELFVLDTDIHTMATL